MNILIEEKDLKLLKSVASKRGQEYPDFVRLLLKKELAKLGLLSKSEIKALEVV